MGTRGHGLLPGCHECRTAVDALDERSSWRATMSGDEGSHGLGLGPVALHQDHIVLRFKNPVGQQARARVIAPGVPQGASVQAAGKGRCQIVAIGSAEGCQIGVLPSITRGRACVKVQRTQGTTKGRLADLASQETSEAERRRNSPSVINQCPGFEISP